MSVRPAAFRRKAVKKGRSLTSGCFTIEIHGTDEECSEMWAKVAARADEMYEEDGGRDLPDSQHPRTHAQRLFDAFYELLTQQPGAGRLINNETGEVEHPGGEAASVAASSPKPPSPKTMLHVTPAQSRQGTG